MTPQEFEKWKNVKPEFGNTEHINAIRSYQSHFQDLDCGKTKLFKVEIEVSGSDILFIEAIDEENAKQIAFEKAELLDYQIDAKILKK